MPKRPPQWFKIKLTKNRTYSLSGTIGGKQHRKRFKTESEAKAYGQRIEIEHWNETRDGQLILTRLSETEINDATAAIALIKDTGSTKSLTFAARYLVQHHHETANERTVGEAVVEYLDQKSREEERGAITPRVYRSIGMELNKLKSQFADRVVSSLTPKELTTYLETPIGRSKRDPSDKTWNNRRGYLNTFFRFCVKQRFLAENPVAEIPQRKKRIARGIAETLTADRASELMRFLEAYRGNENKDSTWWGEPGWMVPYFALALFAGIRPDWKDGELSKLRSEDIRMDTNVILIRPEVSKVNLSRRIKIQPNLRLWLEKYPLEDYPIKARRRFRDMRLDVRKRFSLGHDVLRHTFTSMTVGAFRSVGDASLQAGDSERVVQQHYLDLKSEEEADQFWQIIPSGAKLPKKFEKRGGRYVYSK